MNLRYWWDLAFGHAPEFRVVFAVEGDEIVGSEEVVECMNCGVTLDG